MIACRRGRLTACLHRPPQCCTGSYHTTTICYWEQTTRFLISGWRTETSLVESGIGQNELNWNPKSYLDKYKEILHTQPSTDSHFFSNFLEAFIPEIMFLLRNECDDYHWWHFVLFNLLPEAGYDSVGCRLKWRKCFDVNSFWKNCIPLEQIHSNERTLNVTLMDSK